MTVSSLARSLVTVRAKVIALAIAPLLGLIVVGVVELTTRTRVDQARAAHETEADQIQRLKALAGDMHAARLLAEEFRHGLIRKAAEDFQHGTGRLIEMLREEGNAGRWPSAPALIPAMQAVQTTFDTFVNDVATLGLTESEGLNSELRLSGLTARHAILGQSAALGPLLGSIQETLSELAISERELKTGRDMSIAGLIDDEVRRLMSLLKTSAIPAAGVAEIGDKLKSYQAMVGNWSRQRTAADRSFGRFAEAYTVLLGLLSAENEAANVRGSAALTRRAMIDAERGAFITVALGIATLLAAFLSMVVLRAFSTRFGSLINATRALSRGATDVDLDRLKGKDEIGEMATALAVFRDQAIERQLLVTQRANEAETRAAAAQQVGHAIGSFENGIDQTLAKLRGAAGTLEEFARQLDETSTAMSSKATMAGDDTETSSSEIESVASAAHQLTASVHEVASQAVRSDQVAGQALAESARAAAAMHELGKQTDRVGEIVGMIEAIAAQTNLLALNATIEAARAGEAGRGFAVVAQEVKTLAGQTALATREIADQIGGIRTASARAATALDGANHTMSELSRIAASVAAAVEEQSTAISSISQNVAGASRGASSCAASIRQVEAMAQDTRVEAARVSDLARSVTGETERLSEEVRQFLRTVSAA
jgi:methyl-accepting chemotaxis protein